MFAVDTVRQVGDVLLLGKPGELDAQFPPRLIRGRNRHHEPSGHRPDNCALDVPEGLGVSGFWRAWKAVEGARALGPTLFAIDR